MIKSKFHKSYTIDFEVEIVVIFIVFKKSISADKSEIGSEKSYGTCIEAQR